MSVSIASLNKKDVEMLKEALAAATFERMDVGTPEENEFIREKTRLYRETWIVYRLRTIINKLERRSNNVAS